MKKKVLSLKVKYHIELKVYIFELNIITQYHYSISISLLNIITQYLFILEHKKNVTKSLDSMKALLRLIRSEQKYSRRREKRHSKSKLNYDTMYCILNNNVNDQ